VYGSCSQNPEKKKPASRTIWLPWQPKHKKTLKISSFRDPKELELKYILVGVYPVCSNKCLEVKISCKKIIKYTETKKKLSPSLNVDMLVQFFSPFETRFLR
jgi:hypothetical protein